jgi:hypothetical protein
MVEGAAARQRDDAERYAVHVLEPACMTADQGTRARKNKAKAVNAT